MMSGAGVRPGLISVASERDPRYRLAPAIAEMSRPLKKLLATGYVLVYKRVSLGKLEVVERKLNYGQEGIGRGG